MLHSIAGQHLWTAPQISVPETLKEAPSKKASRVDSKEMKNKYSHISFSVHYFMFVNKK